MRSLTATSGKPRRVSVGLPQQGQTKSSGIVRRVTAEVVGNQCDAVDAATVGLSELW